jgi:hypothetical protein
MVMWFISGIVMMYVPYSRVQEAARLHMQQPIPWQSCCNYGSLIDDAQIARAQVEIHLGMPALRLRLLGERDFLFDLTNGVRIPVDADTARKVALEARSGVIGRPATIIDYEQVPFDQFTLGRAPRDRPFHRFTFDDPDRTTIYVSGTAGQIVTWTTAGHRFWNWLGTIPHFLYFQSLRVQQEVWSQTVIWTSLLGTFLTVVGIILGVAQLGRGKEGKLSPYRGRFYWHHVVGLIFGVLTLTWVFSGLISMNPWGFLEGRGRGEASLVEGSSPRWKDVKASLEALRTQLAGSGVVSLTTAPFGGRLYWMATFNDGGVKRLDISGHVAQTSEAELAQAAQRIAGDVSLSAVLFAAVIGIPFGALIALTRFRGREVMIVVLNALMGLPPVVVGLAVFLSLSRSGPLGSWGLLFTSQAMVIASLRRSSLRWPDRRSKTCGSNIRTNSRR